MKPPAHRYLAALVLILAGAVLAYYLVNALVVQPETERRCAQIDRGEPVFPNRALERDWYADNCE